MSPTVLSVVEIAITALAPVLLALLGLLMIKLHNLIDHKVKNEKLRGILDRLADGAMMVVREVEQTFVSKLDPATPEESMKQAKDMAVANLKTWVGPKGMTELKTILGLDDAGATQLLSTHIEASVNVLKKDRSW